MNTVTRNPTDSASARPAQRTAAARSDEITGPVIHRLGYLTGNFPQRTHIFFWREIEALRDLGIEVRPVSTRKPGDLVAKDQWGVAAAEQTRYLTPIKWRDVPAVVFALLRAGPRGWGRALRSWLATDARRAERLRLLGFLPLASYLWVVARREGWQHVLVGFTENAANIALFANRLHGPPYSVSIGHSIRASGPNQPEKWKHALRRGD